MAPPPFVEHPQEVRSLAFSPDGLVLASAGRGGTACRWSVETSEPAGCRLAGRSGHIRSIAFRPDGNVLAAACAENAVQLWDVRTDELTGVLAGHSGAVLAVSFSPDGTLLASGGGDHSVRLWDSTAGTPIAVLTGHSDAVRAVAFSPEGHMLASAGDDGVVRLWEIAGENQIAALTGHSGPVRDVAFSPDGRLLATAGGDHTVRLWDSGSGVEIATLTGHTNWVFSVAFSPDGLILASSGGDRTVRLWDVVARGPADAPLLGHDDQVRSVAFSPDGQVLASAGDDRAVRLWDMLTHENVAGHASGPPVKPPWSYGVALDDSPATMDRLGFQVDVNALAALIAAGETMPPLAIAVTGRWGAGKTSFALQLRDALDRLVAGDRDRGHETFVSSLCHVMFNAWHYSDDHLWVGIIDNLFRSLADYCDHDGLGSSADPEQARDKIDRLTERQLTLEREHEEIDRELRLLRPDPDNSLAAARVRQRARLRWQALRQAAGRGWRWWLPAGTLMTGVGIALAVAGYHLYGWLIAAMPWVTRAVESVHKGRREYRKRLDELVRTLTTRTGEITEELDRIRTTLTQLNPVQALRNFLQQRSAIEAYGLHRGVVGLVHRDLDELHRMLDRAAAAPARDGVKRPPDRIVLYIDDMDRCRPDRIADVLLAINFLQNLLWRRFVVVVTVDADPLIRALSAHYRTLFGGANTPEDYLDKIFQLTVAVRSPSLRGICAIIREIVGSTDPEPSNGATPATEPVLAMAAAAAPDGGPPPATSLPSTDNNSGRHRAAWVAPLVREPSPQDLAERARRALRLREEEAVFMDQLAPLFDTPRSAKHMVNLYKLVRLGVLPGELPAFFGEGTGKPPEFHAAQVLLAIMARKPACAREIFADLHRTPDATDVLAVIGRDPAGMRGERRRVAELLAKHVPGVFGGDLEVYKRWAHRIARYSFHTQTLG